MDNGADKSPNVSQKPASARYPATLVLACAACIFAGAALGALLQPTLAMMLGVGNGNVAVQDPKSQKSPAAPEGEPVSREEKVSKAVEGVTAPGGIDSAGAYSNVSASVVSVRQGGAFADRKPPFFTPLSGPGSVGAGMVIRDRHILTNQHVIAGEGEIHVGLPDGSFSPATVVGADELSDLAVLRVDRGGLPVPEFATGDTLRVGDLLMAVGTPGGLERTATLGIVSAVHRSAYVPASRRDPDGRFYSDLIETDAAFAPGSSGGPLLDIYGRVVAIGTLVSADPKLASNLGFAVPIDLALSVADKIITGKKIEHVYVGIQGQDLSIQVATDYDLGVKQGVVVTSVIPGSPAARAGLKEGDIVVSADGRPIQRMSQLVAAIRTHAPADRMLLGASRNGRTSTYQVTVARPPR